MLKKIPSLVLSALDKLKESNFEAYLVGGCVRDLVLDIPPKDWDIATNAKPEEIIKIFGSENTFYENKFFTVGIKTENPSLGIIEVTTYRTESAYSDKRRPDQVYFASNLEEDLGRRDFTMNAMALDLKSSEDFALIDPFEGKKDIENKLIKTVGSAEKRFGEDALRMMRAIRFHAQLGFRIEKNTLEAIKKNSQDIKHVAWERIGVEFSKIILSSNPAEGIDLLRQTNLLGYLLPELAQGIGVSQNHHHIHSVYKHSLLSLKYCPSPKLEVRLAALFHDIAKPQTKQGQGKQATFYNHEYLGAKIVKNILRRFCFSTEIINKVFLLIANHMFYYNPEEVTESSVRKLIRKVGLENMQDLIDLRIADRLGSGTPKAKPYKLRHLEYIIEKVSQDPISVKMLKINGNDLQKNLHIPPGPKIGAILEVLLAEAIEDPKLNDSEKLTKRALELDKQDLTELRQLAKNKIEEEKEKDDSIIKKRHWVK